MGCTLSPAASRVQELVDVIDRRRAAQPAHMRALPVAPTLDGHGTGHDATVDDLRELAADSVYKALFEQVCARVNADLDFLASGATPPGDDAWAVKILDFCEYVQNLAARAKIGAGEAPC